MVSQYKFLKNRIRIRSTLEFIEAWEMMYNVNFKVVEFDHFKMQAGLPGFVLSVSDIDLCDTIQQFNA